MNSLSNVAASNTEQSISSPASDAYRSEDELKLMSLLSVRWYYRVTFSNESLLLSCVGILWIFKVIKPFYQFWLLMWDEILPMKTENGAEYSFGNQIKILTTHTLSMHEVFDTGTHRWRVLDRLFLNLKLNPSFRPKRWIELTFSIKLRKMSFDFNQKL